MSPAGSAGPAGTFCQWPQSFSPRDLGLGSLDLCPTSVWAPFPFPGGQHQGRYWTKWELQGTVLTGLPRGRSDATSLVSLRSPLAEPAPRPAERTTAHAPLLSPCGAPSSSGRLRSPCVKTVPPTNRRRRTEGRPPRRDGTDTGATRSPELRGLRPLRVSLFLLPRPARFTRLSREPSCRNPRAGEPAP